MFQSPRNTAKCSRHSSLSVPKIGAFRDFVNRFFRGLQIGIVNLTVELDCIDLSSQCHQALDVGPAPLSGWRVYARLLKVATATTVQRVDRERRQHDRENNVNNRHIWPVRMSANDAFRQP
jgi:hypothetical protein